MSDEWVDDRLNQAVGRRQADAIRESMASGNTEKVLLRVDENGTVTPKILID